MNPILRRAGHVPPISRLRINRLEFARVGLALLVLIVQQCGVLPAPLLHADTNDGVRSGANREETRPVGELQLVSDDFVRGRLMDSDQPGFLRWRGAGFSGEFDFEVPAIRAIRFPIADAERHPPPAGIYCFELEDGDLLYGSLLALTENEVTIETPDQGPLSIRRHVVRRIVRLQEGNALVYDGPRGLSGWNAEPGGAWSDDGGQISTSEPGTLTGDFQLPAMARIELELTWKSAPDFAVLLGTESTDKSRQHAFRLEAWQDELVLVRERERDADVVFVQKIGPVQGAAKFSIYFDQIRGRLLVHSAGGPLLAELDFQERNPSPQGGIELMHSRGEIRMERLRITRWNGQTPRAIHDDQERVYLADGTVRYGKLRSFRSERGQFVMSGDGREVVVEQDQFESAALVSPATSNSSAALPSDKMLRVIRRDGERVTGQLKKIEAGQVWLSVPGFREPWRTSLADLHSMVVLRHDVPSTPIGGRIGRLEMPGVRLQGILVDGTAQQGSSGLVWHPRGSRSASPLRAGAVGRIVYHEPRSAAAAASRGPEPRGRAVPAPQVGIVGGFLRVLTGDSSTSSKSRTTLARALHLRTGDVIPGDVERIDESGVTFRTQISEATFVPHEKIKSLDVDMPFGAPATDPVKRERLLTLPRLQRGNPPTHLILSRNGDYLRARLLEMDQKVAKVELRLEVQAIPRERIAQIIWLHDDELATDAELGKSDQDHAGIRVQAVRHDGIRLTFVADQVSEEAVVGNSDVLGPCRVKVDDVDQFLLGEMIEQFAARLSTHQWRLQHAPDPKYLEQSSDPSAVERMPGTESPLVGEMAPPVSLPLLSGGRFDLEKQRGKVVILDFWATWCGPCLQIMPQIERVVDAFDEEQVVLVAVNLQETPDSIRSTLERWRLHPEVALDRDGVAALRYQVTAIPQTVIVDREGRIARLFVGGGSDFGERLEEALKEILSDEK